MSSTPSLSSGGSPAPAVLEPVDDTEYEFSFCTPGAAMRVSASTTPATATATPPLTRSAAAAQGDAIAVAALATVSGAPFDSGADAVPAATAAPWLANALLTLHGFLADPALLEGSAASRAAAARSAAFRWAARPETQRAAWRGASAALAGYCAGVAVGSLGRSAALGAGTVLVGVQLLAHAGYIEGFHGERLASDALDALVRGVVAVVDMVAAPPPAAAAALAHSPPAAGAGANADTTNADNNSDAAAADSSEQSQPSQSQSAESRPPPAQSPGQPRERITRPLVTRSRLHATLRRASAVFARDPPAVGGFAAGFLAGVLF